MNVIHCPGLDRLGHELIEAYRHTESLVETSESEIPGEEEVMEVHRKMTVHRESCAICLHNALMMAGPRSRHPLMQEN